MSGIAVVGVQREQGGAEHTALRCSGVEHKSGEGVTANQGRNTEFWALYIGSLRGTSMILKLL